MRRLKVLILVSLFVVSVLGCTQAKINEPPNAKITVSSTWGYVGSILKFSANESTDPNGDPLTFKWDFDDGTEGEGAFVKHAWSKAGKYTVRLTASDGKLEDTDEVKITIHAPTNKRPIARISVSIDGKNWDEEGNDVIVTVGTNDSWRVYFDASNSYDPDKDGEITEYMWDFESGDQFEVDSTDVKTDWEFRSGVYKVELKVRDDKGDESLIDFLKVYVNYKVSYDGTISGHGEKEFELPVRDYARYVNLTLKYPTRGAQPLPLNDLDLVLLDDNDTIINSTDQQPTEPAEDEQTEEITVDYKEIENYALGTWTARVESDTATSVDYTLSIDVDYTYNIY